MTEAKDYIEMALKAAQRFANGGTLSAKELDEIIEIAERDGVIDRDEIRVLRNTITRFDPSEVTPSLRRKLGELANKLGDSSGK